jgi:hypothetical protein
MQNVAARWKAEADAERALADDLAAALDGYPSTSEHGEWDDDREAALARYREARR